MNRQMLRVRTQTALCGVLTAIALCTACEPTTPLGLGAAVLPGQAPGPKIVFKPLERPQPEIPFPNDMALHVQPDGTDRLNVSIVGPTRLEAAQRKHFNEVDGFSGLSPISVAFDGPIDLTTVTDNTIYVINVQPGSKRLGERIPLDLGRGWFPHQADPHAYLPLDPLGSFDSYVMPPDNMIDSDNDGKPDKWVYHYEVKTHTLDIRPIVPLESGAQYAVVLTRGLKGWTTDGNYGPVQSPFDTVNDDSQTEGLRRALPSLQEVGLASKDIAFGWTLTTGNLARTYRALRDGLYGKGQFAWLHDQFPAKFAEIDDLGINLDGDGSVEGKPFVPGDSPFVLQAAFMKPIIGLINQAAPDVGAGGVDHCSHFVFGSYETPNFRATPDAVWQLDIKAGKADVDPKQFHERVPFMLVIPKTTAQHKPPFPVNIHAHATGTSRVEALLLSDRLAEAGIATFSIDAVGHGPVLPDPLKFLKAKGDYVGLVAGALPALLYSPEDAAVEFPDDMSDEDKVTKLLKNGFVQEIAVKGRATDYDGDCQIVGGEAYFASDAYQLRDAMRQTTLDYIVGVRVLHSLDPKAVPPVGGGFDPHKATAAEMLPHLMAGDFDNDGILDAGGPDVPYFMTGVSLGGIHTALTAPLEPYIVAAAPDVPGAGLADVFIRTRLQSKVTGLMHAVSGPLLVGCPAGKRHVRMSWNDDSDGCGQTTRKSWKNPKTGQCLTAQIDEDIVRAEADVPEGAHLQMWNLDNGLTAKAEPFADGSFRIAVAGDVGDHMLLQILDAQGKVLTEKQLQTPYAGLAHERNTPDFRRYVQLAANVLEGADAITVADRVLLEPLPGFPATNMLVMLAAQDQTVPFTQGIALARSIGLFGRGESLTSPKAAYRTWTEAAITAGLLIGAKVDPQPLDPTHPEGGDGLCRTIETVPGQPGRSGVCIANVHGHHEYIAQPNSGDAFPPIEGYKGTYTEYHRAMLVTFLHSLGRHITQDPCWGDPKCATAKGLLAEWDLPVGSAP